MIYVDRSSVRVPDVLLTRGAAEFERARTFYDVPEEERRQRRFPFKVFASPEVRAALFELFHGKCAYCEQYYGATQALEIEHYRPKGGVVRPDGTLLPDHYWWLASAWENLYVACIDCNRMRTSAARAEGKEAVIIGKGDRFPLEDEVRRATILAGPVELADEHPLLLDPCSDHPEEHLVFLEDGNVVSDTLRGQTTIEIVGLNRKPLVDDRRRAVIEAKTLFEHVALLTSHPKGSRRQLEDALQRVADLTRPTEEYAGLKRQLVGTFRATLDVEETPSAVGEGAEDVVLSENKRRQAKSSHSKFVAAQEQYSLADSSGDEVYRSVRRRIERIVIRNVKSIQHADLDLTRSKASTAPWTVLLGENASGKSTILQAVALSLVGRNEVERLDVDAGEFVRDAPNVTRGSIDVYVSGSKRSRGVVFTPDGFEFVRSEEPQTLVLGYGEARLLPSPGLPTATGTRWCRVEGLFRPARALTDANAWLLRADDATFDYVGGSLQDMLGLPRRDWLWRSDSAVYVQEHGREVQLKQLSTGYQSVLATVIDILEVTLRLWPTPESAEGIVLLDEIGAHLHPTWRMRVVAGLRRMLPSMQFITTTHEPLCLRGLEDGEVVLMRRDAKDRAYATVDLPSTHDLRVDQLLTSKHFGLSTTLDPVIDDLFDEYYQLLSRAENELTEPKRKRRDELALLLRGQGVLGYTRRDQLVYEAIDMFLAEEQRLERLSEPKRVEKKALAERRASALGRVAELWGYAQLAEEFERTSTPTSDRESP